MKFCYIDESGMGEEPYAAMVGVVVDAARMAPTKVEWSAFLAELCATYGRDIEELHTNEFYRGRGFWRDLDRVQRLAIIERLVGWLEGRKHHVVYSVLDKGLFEARRGVDARVDEIGTHWRFLAMHIALAVQKKYQIDKKPKGDTVLVFDNRERDKHDFTSLVRSPPAWTDSYYERTAKQDQLSVLVDVPHFVDSKHVGLIQAADLLSYLVRQHIELSLGVRTVSYHGEDTTIKGWVDQVFGRSIGRQYIYPSKGRCPTTELFYELAPAPARDT